MTYPNVKFPRAKSANFFKTLHKRVHQYFEQNNISKSGNSELYIKTLVMYILYLTPFVLVLTLNLPIWLVLISYMVMGLGLSGIGLCVMHDALHGSYSSKKWVNQLMSYSMNVIGGSAFTWHVQHNVLHHTYTNVYELDEDIDDKPFLRLSPNGKLKKYHRFQHIYALFLYCFATFSWIMQKDFKQLLHYNRTGMTEKLGRNPKKEFLILLFSKSLYWFILLILPVLVGLPIWLVLLGFLLMHMVSGLLITTIFQLAHVVEGPQHFSIPQTGSMKNTWAVHQLTSTANFACDNKIIGWFAGGLNFQVEHHLFPSISHVHYKHIAKIVRETAKEFELPYYEFPKFIDAVNSHLRVLRTLGLGKPLSTI